MNGQARDRHLPSSSRPPDAGRREGIGLLERASARFRAPQARALRRSPGDRAGAAPGAEPSVSPLGVPGAAAWDYGRAIVEPAEPEDYRDELPAELNAAEFVGPYLFPNNSRRRIPSVLYTIIAAICIAVWAVRRDDEPVLVNAGVLIAGIALLVWALYHWQGGWNLAVDENDALVAATRAVGFPVGHASAQMGWRGIRSRPTWRILLYSNEPQPTKRGLVLVDGVDAKVVGQFVEGNPEDFAEYE